MKVDQHSLFVLCGNPTLRCVVVHMHARDFLVLLFNRKQFIVACYVWLHKSRHAGILLQDFRILHVFEMLREICFGSRTQERRNGYGLCGDFDCAVGFDHYFRQRRRRFILSRCFDGK